MIFQEILKKTMHYLKHKGLQTNKSINHIMQQIYKYIYIYTFLHFRFYLYLVKVFYQNNMTNNSLYISIKCKYNYLVNKMINNLNQIKKLLNMITKLNQNYQKIKNKNQYLKTLKYQIQNNQFSKII
ncbi:hypothetical protein IMG5_021710 [Ichthyophthirius multifiliis]|uniref:Uncharacterized protein n=1 Tax=Ichthyophthirius multifiliis TaxID=5932 RepID=G0QKT6_ICHMU|nr:hypothetical protein IMG5_021710 [Ichthyophthirius multifiliis]EGR34171.1 hypothetical protein IMG5_021710 [Ichthyophthirius multifiliis]|eukprot:XP_004039475.1 hypothetical protein IMG5_021710 [Ichthyophthirius multifiliis]